MTKLVLTAKRLLVIIVLLIYFAGTCNDFIIQSSHQIYHLLTHTLHQHHQHEHSHTHSHAHSHEHSHLIDLALTELDHESEQDKSQPEAPGILQVIKFTDHISQKTRKENIPGQLTLAINIPYLFVSVETYLKPVTPPPKIG